MSREKERIKRTEKYGLSGVGEGFGILSFVRESDCSVVERGEGREESGGKRR